MRRSKFRFAAGILVLAALAIAPPARGAEQNPVSQYLNDRAAWAQAGQGCTNMLSMSMSSLNNNGVASYVGALPSGPGNFGTSAPPVTYSPAFTSGGYWVPAKFTVTRTKVMFSDRGRFDPALADVISVQIIMWPIGPVVSVTMHSWGNGVVTFPISGANSGVLYGDDSPQSHVIITLHKIACSPI